MLRIGSIALCLTTLSCFDDAPHPVARPAAPRPVTTADALMSQAPPPQLLLCAPNMEEAELVERQRVFARPPWRSPHDTLTAAIDGTRADVVPWSRDVGADWLRTPDHLVSLTSEAQRPLPPGADLHVRSFASFGGTYADGGKFFYFIQQGGRRHAHPLSGPGEHEILLQDALWMTTSECRLQRAGADGVVRCVIEGTGRSLTSLGDQHILFGIDAPGPEGVGLFDVTNHRVVDLGCELPSKMGTVESPPSVAVRCGGKGGIWTPSTGLVATETPPDYIVGALDERRLEHEERYLLLGSDREAPREYFDAATGKFITTELYLSGATKEGFARHGSFAMDANANAAHPIELPSCGTSMAANPYEAEQWWRTKDRMGHLEIAMCTEWVGGPRLEKMRSRKPLPTCHGWESDVNFVKHYVLIDLRNGEVVPLKGGKPLGLTSRGVVYTRGSPHELDGADGTSIWIQDYPPNLR